MTILRMNTNDRVHFAKQYWDRVWNQMYSHEGSMEWLKGYGLSGAQIQSIVNLADEKSDEWGALRRKSERESA